MKYGILLLTVALVACGGGDASNEAEDTATTETPAVIEHAVEMPDGSHVAGSPLLAQAETITLGEALAHPELYEGKVVRVTAHIDQVCQSSGCWMIVGEEGAESRVTFADYGFFVPKDAAGRTVEMDVMVKRETMSEEVAKHLASETEGEDPADVTGPVETVSVVATGVRILPREDDQGE